MAILEMLPTEHISHTGDTGPRNIYDHFIIFRRKIKKLEDILLIFVCEADLETLMLFVSSSVSGNVENNDKMTE